MSTTSEKDPISTEPNTVEFSKEDVSESNLLGVARINIVNVKNLNSDTLDIRITCLESGNKYSKTHICENINSKWNQVFYIPIYDIKKLKIRVCGDIAFFKSISLGSYIFNPQNFIEGKKLDLERDLLKPKNSILPRPNKGNLRFDADFYSFSNREFTTKTTKFSKNIIFFYSLCNLITQDDSVKLDKLVILFNFNSEKELKELIKTFIDTINDKKVKTISDNILIAALFKASLWNEKDYVPYMGHMMWKHIRENYLEKIDEDIKVLKKKKKMKTLKNDYIIWPKNLSSNTLKPMNLLGWVGEAIQSATIDVSQSTTKSEVVKDFADKFVKEFVEKLTDLIKFQSNFENTKFVSQEVKVTIKSKGEKDDDHYYEKADALDTVKTSPMTKKVVQYVVSKQNDDGSIEVGETVCKQLDAPSKETLVTTVQQYTNNEKLKNAKPTWITTAVNIAYLKNLADEHEGEWKEKYEKARQYLTKEIGNPKEVDELINASSKYVVKQSTQKVIKDKKKAAVLAIRASTPKETINDAISSQKNDGSFEISKTITKELNDTSPEDLVKKAKSYVKSDKIKPENSDSIFKTALMLGYLRTATTDTDSPSSIVSEKYKKAREYLSSQIGDKQLEEDIIKASSKVVIDKSSEKVVEASKKEALKEIQITPEITKTIVSTQKTDGSFEVSKEIIDKLNSTTPESLVTSAMTYTKNEKLKNVHSLVWQTVISMQYLKNTACQYENDWKDKYNKAEEYVRSQLGDDNLVKELLITSNKFVIDRVTRDIVKQKEERILQARKSTFDEDTKNTTISVLKGEYNVEDVLSICSSQKDDGSITLHNSNKVLGKHKTKWINEELEKEILESRKKETDTAKSTEEVIHDALSYQEVDGSLQLTDTVSKELKFKSTVSLVSHVESHLKSEGDKVPNNQYLRKNKQLLHTAIILSFLKTTHIPPELKEKYENAMKYLRTELGSENSKKVMERISMIINVVRAAKEVEEKGLVAKVH